MKKYLSTILIIFLFSCFAMAQLTLKKMDCNCKITLPIDALIEIKLPTETSRPDCTCFEAYRGYLKKVETGAVVLMLTEKNRETVDNNGAAISEKQTFQPVNDATTMRIATDKLLTINKLSEMNYDWQKFGGVVLTLSILSNLFLAPYAAPNLETPIRNIGYGSMALGLATFLLPTKKTFYFEQPKKNKNKKTLWKLEN